jgi:hypothetical protein
MLYNTKVQASSTQLPHLIYETENELNSINFNRLRPLRDISGNTNKFVKVIKLYNQYRLYDVAFSKKLLKKIENRDTFSGDELYQIKASFDLLIKLNRKILEASELYEYPKAKMVDTFSTMDSKNPMLQAHMIYLLANLTVFDHLREVYDLLFARDGSLRRIVKTTVEDGKNEPLKEIEKQLQEVRDTVETKKFIQHLTLMRALTADLRVIFAEDADSWFIISQLVENGTANEIMQGKTNFEISSFEFVDKVVGFFNKLTNSLSQLFGNIAGSISWRKGFLFNSETAYELFAPDLKPMDVLLEKSPFVLTDKFIPGHFGHVALYLGTKDQLQSIGMWNHPDIVPYQEEIENGRVILEAVRSGVRLNTIEGFMNIDEVTVVRKDDVMANPQLVFEQIKRGMDQLGKDYDFNFDISTLDKVVCSELLYIIYGNVNWPTHYRLGRPTVTPDDIAEVIFQKNSRFKVSKYLLSKEKHRLELANAEILGVNFDYELRAENGGPILDRGDQANSFWKKETKCYNVGYSNNQKEDGSFSGERIKECRTTYKEYYYEEWGL